MAIRVFVARYDGTLCGLCSEMIAEGDDVCYVDDELCHAQCAQDEGEGVVW